MAVRSRRAGPPSQEDLERKKRTRNLIILLVVLLVALAVIAFFLLRSLGVFGSNVTVPNVVGLTAGQATQTLHNDNLDRGQHHVRRTSTHHQGQRPVDRPQGGGLGGEELRGGPGRQRRPEHPHRRGPRRCRGSS